MENLKIRRSARKDSERIENLVKEYNFKLVPPADGFCDEEEMICKKISDNDGNMIAGCVGYISPWGCLYVDDLWVDERYRRQELGSHLLQAAEEIAVNRGCYLSYLGTGDFQAKPFYLKHGYALYGTVLNEPVGHESFELFKRLEKGQPKRHCRPIPYKVSDGTEEDMELIGDRLYEYNLPFLAPKHDYIKINRKLVDESGKAVAAIMAGVTESDVGVVWKIWVDEAYRDQGLGTRLINHFEKKAKENGATKIIVEELYDWNVGFFLKNGFKVAGVLSGLPKGHSYYIVDKDF